MNIRTRFVSFGLSVTASLLLLIGCASPEQRIKKNPELYQSFPPDVQALVAQGQIAIGFTAEMVTMAMGPPNRIYSRVSSNGTSEVWSYTSKKTTTDRQRVNADVRYRDANGRYRTTSDWVTVDVARDIEYERVRVEFIDSKVAAIESLEL
jgi:hypothetical protein